MFCHSLLVPLSRYCGIFLSSKVRTASAKSSEGIAFLARISFAIASQRLLHPSTHSSSNFWYKISILAHFDRRNFSVSFISQPTVKASSTALLPRLAMNSAKSLLPSFFCSFAKTRSSNRVFIRSETAIWETSWILKVLMSWLRNPHIRDT